MEIRFWKDKSRKIIDPSLFAEKAEWWANKVAADSGERTNNPTQIRKFYDEVLRFDSMLQGMPEREQRDEFERLLPYIKMLNAKAAYALARNELISPTFKEFVAGVVKEVNDKDDFDACAGFFEAFMGFYKYAYKEKKDNVRMGGGRR